MLYISVIIIDFFDYVSLLLKSSSFEARTRIKRAVLEPAMVYNMFFFVYLNKLRLIGISTYCFKNAFSFTKLFM